MEWIKYLAKLAGALAMGLVGVSFLFSAWVVNGGWTMAGIGLASAIGAFFVWPRTPNAWRRDPPTERQLAYARDLGIRVPRGATKGDVSDAISRVTGR